MTAVKHTHEFRDPVHTFIKLSHDERLVVDSRPFQRLRHIHQLSMSYLVYPGATHTRFEHSLGVMDLASRVFDVVTAQEHRHASCRDLFPPQQALDYWRCCLRVAALCHDLGHLPFSHAAEDTLPAGWDHERLTMAWLQSEEMKSIWGAMKPPLVADDLCKLAIEPKVMKKVANVDLTDWERILCEIITGSAFGVDRIDYLLRDSLHAGVSYGRFDHSRLIDTLRILPSSDGDSSPRLGVEYGGIHAAEALLWARYFMFTQVYLHPIRRIYDIHLKEFLAQWLPGGKFDITLSGHLGLTDNEVLVGIRGAAAEPAHPAHKSAATIMSRQHFRLLYDWNPKDAEINPAAGSLVYQAAVAEFGPDRVRRDEYMKDSGNLSFPVQAHDGRILDAIELSTTLRQFPRVIVDCVYVDTATRRKADSWLRANRDRIIKPRQDAPHER